MDISGIVLGDNVPGWEQLVSWEGPTCVIINAYGWSCGNPPRGGQISTAFHYRVNVLYPKGCKGQGCFSIINHPEYGQICIGDDIGNIAICVDILDPCGNPIRNRDNIPYPFVDMDESVVFLAELSSPNENADFPDYLAGEVDGCGPVYENIQMIKTYSQPGYAEYLSSPYTARVFFPGCPGGDLLFRLSGANDYYETIYAIEVEFTVDRDLNFIDNIEIAGNPATNTVCYPGNSFLTFGVDVTIEPNGWPYPCEIFNTAIKGFKAGEQIIVTSGEAVAGGFTTEPAQSTYEIVPAIEFEEFNLNWMASVNGGTDREARPLSTPVRVYHGFRADDIMVNEAPPPPQNIIPCGNSINLKVNPTPDLAYQDRIIYHWEDTPQGIGEFDQNHNSLAKEVSFTTITTGDVEIRYYIEDNVTGYTSELSAPLTVHSASITVVPPLDDRFTFSPASTGILDGDFHADIEPESIRELVTWTFDPIGSSVLTITPDLPNGDVHFEYENLPTGNDFGEKKVKMASPNPDVSDIIKIRVFFPMFTNGQDFADNHSGGDPAHPNWFHYWKQTNAGAVLVPYGYEGPDCTLRRRGYYNFREQRFYICELAGMFCAIDCAHQNYNGIDLFAVTVRHEAGHYEDYRDMWYLPYGRYVDLLDNDPNPPSGHPLDGDLVPDNLEGSGNPYPQFDPLNWNSDYPSDDHEDFEDLGYDRECSDWTKGHADREDWSNPGHQY